MKKKLKWHKLWYCKRDHNIKHDHFIYLDSQIDYWTNVNCKEFVVMNPVRIASLYFISFKKIVKIILRYFYPSWFSSSVLEIFTILLARLSICWLYPLQRRCNSPPQKMGVLGMTLFCIEWWGSSSGALGNVEYAFRAITSSFTQFRSGNTL